MQISTIGVDLAKNVFQVHGVDGHGKVVITRQLRRKQVIEFFGKLPPCLVGMEACATSHHWARELSRLGHTVRLIPPSYVKAYVKRSKSDAADAAAICEAVTRPSMRFVAIKTAEQQAALMLHRTRDLLIRQRTQLINALRAHLAELGLIAEQGRDGVVKLVAIVSDEGNMQSLPNPMRQALQVVLNQLASLQQQIGKLDRCIHAQHRASDVSRRLESIPSVGVIGATAIAATITDPGVFKSGRDLAAWIGLVPRQNSTGGKERLGRNLQAGRPVSSTTARGRRDCGRPPGSAPSGQVSLGRKIARQEASQVGGCRRCQQDGTDRLGDHDQRWNLSSAAACCGRLKRLGNGRIRRQLSATMELRG